MTLSYHHNNDGSSLNKNCCPDPLYPAVLNTLFYCAVERTGAAMSTAKINEFVIMTFLEACNNNMFHHLWMSVDTWAKAIAHVYCIAPLLTYNGKMLATAVAKNTALTVALNTKAPVNDDTISLHHKILPP